MSKEEKQHEKSIECTGQLKESEDIDSKIPLKLSQTPHHKPSIGRPSIHRENDERPHICNACGRAFREVR